MSSSERCRIENAIWLCQSCSKLIDSDEKRYTPEILMSWRDAAESLAFRNISERVTVSCEAELSFSSSTGVAREIIELGNNNQFAGTEADIKNLATRCAIHVINGKKVAFDIRLLPTILTSQPSDPLVMSKYEAARIKKAEYLKAWMTALTSPNVYEWWGSYLCGVEDWQCVISAFLEWAQFGRAIASSHKIDVWRTTAPVLYAPIHLSPSELDNLLTHLDFQSTAELRFGPGWRAASDMPHDIVVKHVIPRMLVVLVDKEVSPRGQVLNLIDWHIGEG